jgi:hypothetical protein
MNPPTSFKDFATHFAKVGLPAKMETVAKSIGFVQRPISLRAMMDTVTLGSPVPAPATGLSGKSNYIFYSNCNPLIGVTVTINVTQDIVCAQGFSFQLNALSPRNATTSAQQYGLVFSGTELSGIVNNWSGPKLIIPDSVSLVSLPGSTIPAGYQLSISLQNDSKGNVTGATYAVTDNQGNLLKTYPLNLETYGAKSTELAPVVAFQLNLVGPGSSESVVLSSGSGSIVYEASTALTVSNSWPCGVAGGTLENANTTYGMLSPGPSSRFSQPFGIRT